VGRIGGESINRRRKVHHGGMTVDPYQKQSDSVVVAFGPPGDKSMTINTAVPEKVMHSTAMEGINDYRSAGS